MDAFLDAAAQAGRVESSGVFTMDWARARAVFQTITFAEPEFYLVKLIQAGTAAGCKEILCAQAEGRFEMTWAPCLLPDEALQCVAAHLTGGPAPASRPLQHMAQALIQWIGREHGRVSVHSGRSILLLDEHGPRVTPRQQTLSDTQVVIRWPTHIFPEWRGLQARLEAHPLPISRNGQRLEPLGREELLAERVVLGRGAGGLGLNPTRRCRHRDVRFPDGRGWSQLDPGEAATLKPRVLLQRLFGRPLDKLIFVADGVCVDVVMQEERNGFVVIADATSLPTDASSLSLRAGPELDALAEELEELKLDFLEEMRGS